MQVGSNKKHRKKENKYSNHAVYWFAAGAPPWGAPSLACANRVASELPILRDLHTISTWLVKETQSCLHEVSADHADDNHERPTRHHAKGEEDITDSLIELIFRQISIKGVECSIID